MRLENKKRKNNTCQNKVGVIIYQCTKTKTKEKGVYKNEKR